MNMFMRVMVAPALLAAAACTASPAPKPAPAVTAAGAKASVDVPGLEAVKAVCGKVQETFRAVLGAQSSVGAPTSVQSASLGFKGVGPSARCIIMVNLCQPVPAPAVAFNQETMIDVDDILPDDPVSGATEVDGQPVWNVPPYTSAQAFPGVLVHVHNRRAFVQLSVDAVLTRGGKAPSPASITACRASWDKVWRPLAATLINALR